MQATVLEIKWFKTPYSGAAASKFIFEVIKDWGLEMSFMAITTDDSSNMNVGIRKLNIKIVNKLAKNVSTLRFEKFHIRCITHIFNLAVKEFMYLAH